MRGKRFYQRNLVLRERVDVISKQRDQTYRGTVLDQGNKKHATDARCVHHRAHDGTARLVKIALPHVVKRDQPTFDDTLGGIRQVRIDFHLAGIEQGDHFGRNANMCGKGHHPVLWPTKDKPSHRRITERLGLFKNGPEHRRLVVLCLADDLEHIRGRRLTLQPVLDFLKLAHVFDGNDSLGGKRLNQLDFRRNERPNLAAA